MWSPFSPFRRNARQAKPARRTPFSYRPRLETLEDRTLLSNYTAGTVTDLIGDINAANAAGGTNTITLTAAASSPYVLDDTTGALPEITANDNLTINTIDGANRTIERNSSASAFRLFTVDSGASLNLQNLTLTGGLAQDGGAIFNLGTLAINNCTLADNMATLNGGGIFNLHTANVNNSTLADNTANSGGGIYNELTATVSNSTLADNTANSAGGGIYEFGGKATVSNSTLWGNSAGGGGGIFNADFTRGGVNVSISNSTLAGNTANFGGGIENANSLSTISIGNSIVATNTARSGSPDVAGFFAPDLGHNLIGIKDGSVGIFNANGNILGTTANPVDPKLASLGNYGGPTQTLALLPGSPAIDAGSVARAVDAHGNPLTTDQRGVGYPRVINNTVDIGAFEATPPTAVVSGPTAAVAGQVLSYTLSATDPSPVNQAAGFTYTVDWGDGSPGTPDVQTVAVSASNGAGLTVTHAYAAAGAYTVLVTATDQDGSVSTAVSTAVQVNTVTAANLQQQMTPGGTVTVQTTTPQQANDVIAAANGLDPATTPTSTLIVDLGGQTIQDTTINVPPQVTIQFVNGTFIGGSPALIVASGAVLVKNSVFLNATDAPTILVTGGSLTLRNDMIQESTGSSDPAIDLTGGTVDLGIATDPGGNTINLNGPGAFVHNTTSTPIAAVGDTFTVNGLPLTPSTLSGTVFEDFNDDGQIDFGEKGIANVHITLTGTDDLGKAISQSQLTDSGGAYVFLNLRPGNYTVTETQPAGYGQGIDSVGTAGGGLSATDQFFVQLAPEVNGLNYNFGEQPAGTGPVQKGQTAGIGFWNNKNGQALILAFNGGTGTQLADWLAATLPNMFGANAGSNDLAGKSNAYVAALFQSDFVVKGVKLDAQVLATALSVYATNATLDNTQAATKYGFVVSGDGVGTATANVGSNGDAFGVANNTTLTVMDMLLATDAQAINGLLYNGNTTKQNEANAVYSALNEAGSIS